MADYVHVAVDKKQPGIFRLPCQEVADGSPAHVLFSLDVAAMGEGVDDTVALYGSFICGTIIGD